MVGQFQPNLAQSILGWRGIKFVQMKGHAPFQRGDNSEIVNIHWKLLKIFFSRTSGPISTKLGTEHSWVKGIQVCSSQGPCPSPRGDNSKIVKLYLKYLKIFCRSLFKWRATHFSRGDNLWNCKIILEILFKSYFSNTSGPVLTKFGTKYSWVKGILI